MKFRKNSIVSQAAYAGHLVYTLRTLGQCKARLLNALKAWQTCSPSYGHIDLLNWQRGRDTMPNKGGKKKTIHTVLKRAWC